MKTIINSLIELVDISDNKNRIELYKEMFQKLRNETEEEQYQLMKLFYSNLCGLLAHSEMKRNEYDKLKEVFLPTFKNNIIVKKIQEYDLSGLTFVFSDVNVVSKNKANSVMVINFATASNYYKLTWKKTDDNVWKISNVAEKK